MLQDGGGQVQTTQAQWRKQQLQMHKQKQQQIIHQHRAAPAVCCHVRHGQTAISRTEESSAAQPECQLGQQVQLQQHTIQVSWSDSDGKLLANVPSKKIIYYFP